MPPGPRKLVTGPCAGAVTSCLLLLLPACTAGSDGDQLAASSSVPSPSAPSTGDLVIELDHGDGSAAQRYTLHCADPVSGDLPDAAAACAHLQGRDDPFAALPAGQVCTQQYGGPQTARITGRWAGADVDLTLARTNGCQLDQWNSLRPLLPGPVG